MASVVTWAAVFLLPVFVQSVQGRSALAAGIAMAPQGVVTGLSTALGSRVITRFTVRSTVCCGFAVLRLASLLLVLVGAGTSLWVIALMLAVRSVSTGLVISPVGCRAGARAARDGRGDRVRGRPGRGGGGGAARGAEHERRRRVTARRAETRAPPAG